MQEKINAKLNTERELSGGKGFVQVYDVARYTVVVRGQRESTGNHLWVEVRKNQDITDTQYLPSLSVGCFDDEGFARRADVSVGTTSYGALSLAEIGKFMNAMAEGIAVAKYVSEKFLQPMVDGEWNWEVSK